MEWSGSSGVVESTSTNPNAATGSGANNMSGGSVSTAQKDLVIGGFCSTGGSAMTAGTNVAWTAITTGSTFLLGEAFPQAASGSTAVDGTQSGGSGLNYAGIGVAFEPTGAAGSATMMPAIL